MTYHSLSRDRFDELVGRVGAWLDGDSDVLGSDDVSILVAEAIVLRAVVDDIARSGSRPLDDVDSVCEPERQHRTRSRRRWLTPQLLDEVAQVYAAGGRRPLVAVADHFQKSPAQASRYVQAARADGKIPPKFKLDELS